MDPDSFGSNSKPFNPREPCGFYHKADFEAAGTAILRGIRTGQGLMLLTGEAGLGKTLLLRRCMAESNDIHFILLGNANLEFPEILNYLCAELGLHGDEPKAQPSRQLLLDALADYFSRGQAVALLIDDAQNLRVSTLRCLWDFMETSGIAVIQRLQVVLSGLPDIENTLRQPELRPLWESLQIHCRLERLSELETGSFITHQLQSAGRVDAGLLSPAAVERIAHYSQGIPRTIARLCDAVLLFASLRAETEITPATVDEAAQSCLFGDRTESPKPVELERFIAPVPSTPPLAAEAPLRGIPSRTLVKRWVLAALTTVAIIWLWPAEPVPEDQSPHNRQARWEPPGDLPDASPPISTEPLVPAAMPATPVEPDFLVEPDFKESGISASESQSIPLAETAAEPLIEDLVSDTPLEVGAETNPQVAESRADPTQSPTSNTAQTSPRATGKPASRIQSQPRATKSRKATTRRKSAGLRGIKVRPAPYPWESPNKTGFNQK